MESTKSTKVENLSKYLLNQVMNDKDIHFYNTDENDDNLIILKETPENRSFLQNCLNETKYCYLTCTRIEGLVHCTGKNLEDVVNELIGEENIVFVREKQGNIGFIIIRLSKDNSEFFKEITIKYIEKLGHN